MSPPPTDLTSLAAVKTWLQLTTTTDDALLGAMISQLSRAIYSYINRPYIFPKTVTENFDGNGRNRLQLRNWPVNAVASVSINGVVIEPAPLPGPGVNPGAGWLLEPSDQEPPGGMQSILLNGYCFYRGVQNVQITYGCGYLISGEAQTASAWLTAFGAYGQWATDQGVTYAGGPALTAVSGAPSPGQYSVNGGAYVFNAADAGAAVLLSYGYVPDDLAQCAIEWVAERYRYRERIGLNGKTLGGQETVSYRVSDIPDFVKPRLNAFARVLAN